MEEAGVEVQTDFIRGAQGIQGDKGEQGEKGDKGDKGDKGEAFTYSDLTPEQIEELRQQIYEGLITQDEMDIILGGIDTNLNTMQDNIEAEIGTKISNKLINYQGDLNDIKTTSFTYAAGDAINIPTTGYSFYVTTIAFNEKYVHQTAKRVTKELAMEEYKRQCFNGTWTEWKITNGLKVLTAGQDFNAITTSGKYAFNAIPTGSNRPINLSGYLEVFTKDTFTLQRYTSYKGRTVHIRGYYKGTWFPWKEISVGIVLWTNPNPTAEFPAQNITLSSSEYKYLEVLFKDSSTFQSEKTIKGSGVRAIKLIGEASGEALGFRIRTMSYVNDTTYSFTNGLLKRCNVTTEATVANLALIPYQIIGYN